MSEIASKFQDVLQLGRKLVGELESEAQRDVLARWMAHHVAECITKAEETADASDMAAAADAILGLWDHRHSLPRRSRPLRDFEAIFDTLAKLDPSNHFTRYYRATREAAEAAEKDKETKQWLDLAEGVDVTARFLIREFLEAAAESADQDIGTWIEAARAAGLEPELDLRTIRVLTEQESVPIESEDESVKRAEKLLEKLKAFQNLAGKVTRSLEDQVDSLKSSQS